MLPENYPMDFDDALKIILQRMLTDPEKFDVLSDVLSEVWHSYDLEYRENIVESFTSDNGDFGEYNIDIHEFCGLYFINAADFDDIGYFTSLEDAITYAKYNYGISE